MIELWFACPVEGTVLDVVDIRRRIYEHRHWPGAHQQPQHLLLRRQVKFAGDVHVDGAGVLPAEGLIGGGVVAVIARQRSALVPEKVVHLGRQTAVTAVLKAVQRSLNGKLDRKFGLRSNHVLRFKGTGV